ncbi:hypothetical protein ACI65C_004072 [Semiaphis heraclei]
MLYLEDFLDKLELLPQEVHNQTSEIRQLDQQVKDSMDCIKKNVDNLFSNANTMHPNDLHADFKAIMKVGDKVLKKSDEKIQIANNMHKLMEKYMNHIDIELQKFKKDLYVSSSSTTELNDKKIEEVLNKDSSSEEEFIVVDSNFPNTGGLDLQTNTIPTYSQKDPYPLAYTLEHMEAGSSGISAAGFKANVATKKRVKGCRTANLKLSTTANNRNKKSSVSVALSSEKPICKDFSQSKGLNKNRAKKHTKQVLNKNKVKLNEQSKGSNKNQAIKHTKKFKQKKTNSCTSITEDNVQLNEPRYCLCNEVAYNTMIACDNSKCPYEWFHFECVGIESEPTGKWYCPKCVIKLKKRRQ